MLYEVTPVQYFFDFPELVIKFIMYTREHVRR